MRNLDITETLHISAAASVSINCVTVESWQIAHNTASRDATTLTIFGGMIVGGGIGAFTGVLPGVMAAAFVAPYIWGYTYFDSSAWNKVFQQKV